MAQAQQLNLPATLDELTRLGGDFLRASRLHHLEEARDRLLEQRFNLVVLGEFKRGKSTLINALLERPLLPTGVLPLTSAITIARHGESERLLVRFDSGNTVERPLDELRSLVTEEGNPQNGHGVAVAVVETPTPLLQPGLQLVDTPGIGSVYEHNTEVARDFLPQVDAALFVLTAEQPLTRGEQELVQETAERVPRLFFALNKIDVLAKEERGQAIEFVRAAVEQALGEEPELFAVSAREGSGVGELRRRLQQFASRESQGVLVSSVRRLAAALAAEAAEAARLEATALELPVHELESRIERFEQRVSDLVAAREDASDLLEQGVKRTLRQQVDEPLLGYAAAEADSLRAELRAAAAGGASSPRRLAHELDDRVLDTVRRRIRELAPCFEQSLGNELAALQRRYAERVSQILAVLRDATAEVFGSAAGSLLPELGLQAPSHFTFKLRDEEQGIDHLAALGRTSMPGALGRWLVVREAEQRLLTLIDRHAGRLRSDLNERAWASVRKYDRALAFVVDEAVQAVRDTVERASGERRSTRREIEQRLESLATSAARLDKLAHELATGAGPPALSAAVASSRAGRTGR